MTCDLEYKCVHIRLPYRCQSSCGRNWSCKEVRSGPALPVAEMVAGGCWTSDTRFTTSLGFATTKLRSTGTGGLWYQISSFFASSIEKCIRSALLWCNSWYWTQGSLCWPRTIYSTAEEGKEKERESKGCQVTALAVESWGGSPAFTYWNLGRPRFHNNEKMTVRCSGLR